MYTTMAQVSGQIVMLVSLLVFLSLVLCPLVLAHVSSGDAFTCSSSRWEGWHNLREHSRIMLESSLTSAPEWKSSSSWPILLDHARKPP